MTRKQFIAQQIHLRSLGHILSPAHTRNYHRLFVTTPWGVPGDMWAAHHHTGEDYQAVVGSLASPTCWGHILDTGVNAGDWGEEYGNLILMRTRNGKWDVGFAHLSRISVKVGAHVVPGQVIGLTGQTGNVTGAHLHYEVRPAGGHYGDDVSPLHVEHK